MNRKRIGITLAFAAAFAVDRASAATRPGSLGMPEFARVPESGAAVTDITMPLRCMGVVSIEGVPDGCSFAAMPDGERHSVRIAREDAEAWLTSLGIPGRDASNRQLQAIRIGVAFRGPWSDCAGAGLTLRGIRTNADGTSSGFIRDFRSAGVSGRWESDGRAAPRP